MPQEITLDAAVESILDAAVSLLSAETRPGGELAAVADVVRGEQTNDVQMPVLWVYAEPATTENAHALHETWTLPLLVVATVEEASAVKGYRLSGTLAAAARRVLLRKGNRRLGLERYVQDTQSARYEASAPWSKRGNLFDALAVVNVIFTVYEP